MMSPLIWMFCLSLPSFLASSLTSSLTLLNPLEQEGPEVACLDHSDCTQLGHKFGCLIYRCVDHSQVQACQSAGDCPAESDCQLTRLPGYPSGLCVPLSSLLACSDSSCPCCGQHCCPPHYHSQWADMRCVSHHQCQVWATGQYCCQDGRCCEDIPEYEEDDYYQYQYDYYNNNNYSDYYSSHSYDYITTTSTSIDNSSDVLDNEDLEEDIFPRLLNETTAESVEYDYDFNNSSDLFENTEPVLVNETSGEDYYANGNSSDLFEYAEDILSGLGNETTTEPEGDYYDINNSSDPDPDNIYTESRDYDYEDDAADVADVEIVTIDKTEDDEEQAVKVTTFYETFNKSSAEEKVHYDPTSGVENVTRDDVYYSGSGDVSQDLSAENLNDEELTDGLQIENFSLEADDRELSTLVTESSLEISLAYDNVLDDLQVETSSGSGDQLFLQEDFDGDLEGSGSDLFSEINNISQTYEDSLAETENLNVDEIKSEADLDIRVKDVEVVKKPTNLVGKSTNEVAWKSEAIGKKISVSLTIFVILTMNI